MRRREPRLFLEYIEDAISQILDYTSGGEEAFRSSQLVQDAVVRQIEVIGEAVNNLPADLLERESNTPWKRAVAMRNMLIHGYYDVDLNVVWDTVQQDIPALRVAIARMLQSLE